MIENPRAPLWDQDRIRRADRQRHNGPLLKQNKWGAATIAKDDGLPGLRIPALGVQQRREGVARTRGIVYLCRVAKGAQAGSEGLQRSVPSTDLLPQLVSYGLRGTDDGREPTTPAMDWAVPGCCVACPMAAVVA